jgi:hypothetical protein
MKHFDLKYNKGIQIHCWGVEHLPPETKYLFQIFEKIPNSTEYGLYQSLTMQRFHFHTLYRSYVGDFKIEVFYFDEVKGLIKLEETFPTLNNKDVRIDLHSDDYYEAGVWLDSCFEFYNKHKPKTLIIASNFSKKFKNLHTKYPIHYIELDFHLITENLLTIKKSDPEESGVNRYGKEYIMQNVNHLTDGGWRLSKSFDFPRDWNYISTEDFSNDILGLPPRTSYRGKYTDYNFYTKVNQPITNFNQ